MFMHNKKGVGLLLHDPEIERIARANQKVVRQLMFEAMTSQIIDGRKV